KEVNKLNSTSYTTFHPNLNAKMSNVISGIVDLTVHLEKTDDERYINLIPDQYTFGGGRFRFKKDKVELNRESFEKALKEAQQDRVEIKEEPKEKIKEENKEETSIKTEEAVEIEMDKHENHKEHEKKKK